MSMSSEQAFEYLNKLKSNQADDTAQVADTTPNEDTTPVESNEVESKSEDDNVASPDNATKTEIQSTNDNQSNTEESNGSGEPRVAHGFPPSRSRAPGAPAQCPCRAPGAQTEVWEFRQEDDKQMARR